MPAYLREVDVDPPGIGEVRGDVPGEGVRVFVRGARHPLDVRHHAPRVGLFGKLHHDAVQGELNRKELAQALFDAFFSTLALTLFSSLIVDWLKVILLIFSDISSAAGFIREQ